MAGLVHNAGRTVWSTIKDVAGGALKGVNQIRKDTEATYAGIRAIGYSLLGITSVTHKDTIPSAGLIRGGTMLQHSIGVIDTAMVAADLNYFVSGRFKKDHPVKVAGKIAMTVANLSGAVLWFAKLGFYKLGKAALNIGGKITAGAAGVGFVIFGFDSVRSFIKAENREQKTKSTLEIVACVAEVALISLGLAGVASVGLTVGLGLVAVGFGLTSFLYAQGNRAAIEGKKKPNVPAPQPQPILVRA